MSRRIAFVLLAVGALTVRVPGQQAPLQKVAINFPTRSAASWPMFIAKEGGYYQKTASTWNSSSGPATSASP